MKNLTFERAVDIVVNTPTVMEPPRQIHSPGGATVGENVNRVRFAPKSKVRGDILDRSTDSENRVMTPMVLWR